MILPKRPVGVNLGMNYKKIMKPLIEFADFEKLDLRVGKILSCSIPSWSPKLLELDVDFAAELGRKKIFAGVQKRFKPEELAGKSCTFVVNLAERKMGEGVSQGMMLVAVGPDDAASLLWVSDNVAPGSAVR
jgi:methionyl-tRNA synthetase